MNRSVLEAIQSGDWTYEPEHGNAEFRATNAVPGSPEKLEILARRIQAGLPLWHPDDRKEPGMEAARRENEQAFGALTGPFPQAEDGGFSTLSIGSMPSDASSDWEMTESDSSI